ncbi:MAG: O-antigen ligase family protein [Rhodocyclaceae bacterium]|nr:O-antigen ligase family protein [Rhodocyclaceae bacterium]
MRASTCSDARLLAQHPLPPPALLACLAVALMMVSPAIAGVVLVVLALWGIVAIVQGPAVTAEEREWAWLSLLIPAAYVLNMALTGWAMHLLDRPMHLAYGVLLALVLSRAGLSMRVFALATVVAALAAGGIALYEGVLLDQPRVFGLGGRWNAVPFGNFSLLVGSVALAGALACRHGARHPGRWLAAGVLAFGAGTYASMMSGSRGGWLALPVLVLIASYASRSIHRRHRMMIVGGLLLAAVAAFSASDSVRQRLASAVGNVTAFLDAPAALESMDNASGIRLAMWRWGLGHFVEQPWTGIGYANFAQQRTASVARGEMPAHFDELANLHNELVSSLAFGGLPSAFAVLAFWALGARFFLRSLRRSADPPQRFFATAGLLALVGTALFSMTEGLFGTRAGTYGLTLMLALPAGALCHLARTDKRGSPP